MNTDIPQRVKNIRADNKLSQRALGEAIGTNRDNIKDIENNRKRCSAETWLKIIKLFPENVL